MSHSAKGLSILAGGVAVTVVTLSCLYALSANTESTNSQPSIEPIRRQPVRTVIAKQQPIQAWLFADGTARSVDREYLTFERNGKVNYIKPGVDGGVLRQGDAVARGEVLARLDVRRYETEIETAFASLAEAKTQVEAAHAEIAQSETQSDLAAANFRRTSQLRQKQATSQSEYEEAEAKMKNAKAAKGVAAAKLKALTAGITAAEAQLRQTQLALEETEIKSSIDGIIAYLNIEEGYYFTQNSVRTSSESDALQSIPIVVIDPTSYEITVNIPAYEAARVQTGQNVLIVPGNASASSPFLTENASSETNEAQAWDVRGNVFSVNPAVNPGGRSVEVKVRTTSGANQLRDGSFVACWIEVENKADAVVIPFDAVLYEENRPYVFVVESEVATRRGIVFGVQGLDAREVAVGIQADERLVTDGRYRLVDGAPVRFEDKE